MKFSSKLKIKAAGVTLSEIEKFVDILIKTSEEESKNLNYKIDPQFKIEYKNGRIYKFTTKNEFIEQLKSESLKDIKELELYFGGKQNEIWFHYSINSTQLYLEIKSNQKKSLLSYEEDIKKLFKKNSWNWVIHKLPHYLASSLLSLFIFLILLSLFSEKSLFSIKIELNFSLLLLLAVFLGNLLGIIFGQVFNKSLDKILELYPLLVIIGENDSSGRIFKKDLWKIIIVIITLIIIPILINKFFQK
jgi:hypothetical protein